MMGSPPSTSSYLAAETDAANLAAIVGAVVAAVLKIVVLVCVGVRLELQGMLGGGKRKCLSEIAMEICLPCLLFSDVLPNASAHLLAEGWPLLLWPAVYVPVGAFLGMLCCHVVGIPSRYVGSAAACAAFPNINGFPVAIISALGSTIPNSPSGIKPMTFLSLVQLTDGIVKYTVGPIVFRRDLRAAQMSRGCDTEALVLPLGVSLRSLHDSVLASPPPAPTCVTPHEEGATEAATDDSSGGTGLKEFGLQLEQVRVVEPEWSRFDAYLFWAQRAFTGRAGWCGSTSAPPLDDPLLPREGQRRGQCKESASEFLRKLFPPQVIAVLAALAIGLGPSQLKSLLLAPEASSNAGGGSAPLGFLVGVARQLGGGFVPLQMIALGGRLVNVASDSGPLAAGGAAGPRGRSRLLRIAGAVSVARMVFAPAALYVILTSIVRPLLKELAPDDGDRPLAFWVPALVVAAMPTANNMSTMADLIGSGRSISAATTAMQLLGSPLVLTLSLTLLIAGIQSNLKLAP